jgi:hypothetical protein
MNPILALGSCVSRLAPERQMHILRAYAQDRADGMGDRAASDHVLGLLTESERLRPPSRPPLSKVVKSSRPSTGPIDHKSGAGAA